MLRGRKPAPLTVIDGDGMPMPTPPSFLDAYALEEWNELAPVLHADGRLTRADRGAFAAYCMAYSRWRCAEEAVAAETLEEGARRGALTVKTKSNNVIQNPLVGAANAARRDMVRIAAEFGLTPSARARLGNKDGGTKNKIAKKYFD